MDEDFASKIYQLTQIEKMCENFRKLPNIRKETIFKKQEEQRTERPSQIESVIKLLTESLKKNPSIQVKYHSSGRNSTHIETSTRVGPGTYSINPAKKSSFLISKLPRMTERLDHAIKSIPSRRKVHVHSFDMQCPSDKYKKLRERNKSLQHKISTYKENKERLDEEKHTRYTKNLERKDIRMNLFHNRQSVLDMQISCGKLLSAIGFVSVLVNKYRNKKYLLKANRCNLSIFAKAVQFIGKLKLILNYVRRAKYDINSEKSCLETSKEIYKRNAKIIENTFSNFTSQSLDISLLLYRRKHHILHIQLAWRNHLIVKKHRIKALIERWNRILAEQNIEKQIGNIAKGRSQSLVISKNKTLVSKNIQIKFIQSYIRQNVIDFVRCTKRYRSLISENTENKYKYIKPVLALYSKPNQLKATIEKAKIVAIKSSRKKHLH